MVQLLATSPCGTPKTIPRQPSLRSYERYSALMKNLRSLRSLLVLLTLACGAVAQSDDWQMLKSLPPGAKIKVTLTHKRLFGYCELELVSDDQLGCSFKALGYRQFARADIREVSLGHHAARTGFAVGATAGAILGAAEPGSGGIRGFRALIGVAGFGAIGLGIGTFVDPLLHGKTVYRSADPNAAAKPLPN